MKEKMNYKFYKEKKKNSWFLSLVKDKTFQRVMMLFLISKIIIFTFGTLAQVYYPQDRPVHVVDNWFLNGWAQYDGRAYLSIVTDGYNTEFNGSGNTAWFPLYPLLIKIAGTPFGTPNAYALIGFILSNVFFIIAVFYLFKLVEEEISKKAALKVCAYLLFFPTAYFFSAIYAESLFLLLTVGAFYYANKKMWLWAGIFGFFSALTRTFGVLLFLPFVYMYFNDRQFEIRKVKADILWLGLIPLSLLVYLAYLWLSFGSPFVFIHGHDIYGRYTSWPWVPFTTSFGHLLKAINTKNTVMLLYQTYNLFMTAFFLVTIWIIMRMKKTGYGIYMLLTVLLILVSASLEGLSREIVVVFPMFIALSNISSQKKYNTTTILLFVLFGLLLIVFTLRHLTAYLIPVVPLV